MPIDWRPLLGFPSATPTAPATATPSTPGNPVAGSFGTGAPPFGVTPYVSPEELPGVFNNLRQLSRDYVYSFPAGGYVSALDALNANSAYNKFGGGSGGDPRANQAMAKFYGALGERPTTAQGSPALQKFNAASGIQPKLGPSFNSMLGALMNSPYGDLVREMGLGDKYQGPYAFGKRNPDYNPYGSYKGSNDPYAIINRRY